MVSGPAALDRHGGAETIFARRDRKSTRLNSSHSQISYAVFCLKKKNIRSAVLAIVRCTADPGVVRSEIDERDRHSYPDLLPAAIPVLVRDLEHGRSALPGRLHT